jgi:hypothetical protein
MDFGMNTNTLNLAGMILPLATALGGFSTFPEMPPMLKQLGQNELFRYFCLFVLIWQGGGGQNVQTSLIATLVSFVIVKMLSMGTPTIVMTAPPATAEAEAFYM